VKIKWPKCAWCGSDNVRQCKICNEWTCWECVYYPKPFLCIHKIYEPPFQNMWNIDYLIKKEEEKLNHDI